MLAAAGAWLGGCVTPPLAPRETLDPATGASLVVVDAPLILARERRDVAVQARDYVTLVTAEINVSGRRTLLVAAHQWSTIDSRTADHSPHPQSRLLLVADGRDLQLVPLADPGAKAFASSPALLAPEDANVITTLYEIDAATVEYIATCRSLAAAFPDSFALPFALWRDGRPALRRLLGAITQQ